MQQHTGAYLPDGKKHMARSTGMIEQEHQRVKIYVVEEQEIYRELYKLLPAGGRIELARLSSVSDLMGLDRQVANIGPDVLVVSVKKVDRDIINELEKIRPAYPRMGIVVLLISCELQDLESLKRIIGRGAGTALFLKQSLDQAEQLRNIIVAVHHGQLILDPEFTGLLFTEKPDVSSIKHLTERELEILGLLSRGYTNAKIAERLFINVKTVEHHINSMYSKLKTEAGFNEQHPRVGAARLYLEAVGKLAPSEEAVV